MNLPIPAVGTEAGPQYAIDVNNSLNTIDQHNHSPGSGVQITPNGMNINTALTFNGNLATHLAGLTLLAQTSMPANNTVYENGVDLYYVDGIGNNIRITESGGVAGSPGSISNLTSPASASYVTGSQEFVWQSNTNIAANMDFGSAIMRNLTPNSTFALTLQPPATLSSNFTLTLPSIPGSTSFLTLDTSGIISGSVPVSQGITASNIANGTITTTQIASAANITGSQLAANAGIQGTQLAAAAGILPNQIDSLSSGNYYGISASTGSFTTTSTSFGTPVTVASINVLALGRPIFIQLLGGSIGMDPGSSQAGTAEFRLVFSNTLTLGPVIATFPLTYSTTTAGGNGRIEIPASVLNAVTINTSAMSSFGFIALYARVTASGRTALVTNTQLVVFQV